MGFAERFERTFKNLLPTPFTIAVVLTLLTMVLALLFGNFEEGSSRVTQLLTHWQEGLWTNSLLAFAVQMMLILVLGHTLALAPAVSRTIDKIIDLARTPAQATFLVSFFTLLVAFFNWGLCVIFGAIMARKTGERFAQRQQAINYPLLGAAGYTGMMVWHGGFSGSAPLKVVEEGHIQSMMSGAWNAAKVESLPSSIPLQETTLSPMNITAAIVLLLVLPLFSMLLAKRSGSLPAVRPAPASNEENTPATGAEKLDRSRVLGYFLALLILGFAIYLAIFQSSGFGFISLNYVNFVILGFCLLFHGTFSRFLKAVNQAITGAAGILIQFPLYFGIMAIMRETGLIQQISELFISVSNPVTFPVLAFFSGGLVNVFVPSGGGQWVVQGPILIQASQSLGIPISKSVMALAWGDQITNMLQPFWALPLLGITGLKAREILPYTLLYMLIGTVIFVSLLLIF